VGARPVRSALATPAAGRGEFPHRRFLEFLSLAGYRFEVDGWQHADGRIELVDVEIITWDHPLIDPD
jgi:hypothetical protein